MLAIDGVAHSSRQTHSLELAMVVWITAPLAARNADADASEHWQN